MSAHSSLVYLDQAEEHTLYVFSVLATVSNH